MANWIKLHRGLLDSNTFSNPITLKVWIWVLLNANWKDNTFSKANGRGFIDVTVKRGQLIFGRKTVSEQLDMSEGSLYRHIHKLQEMGNIIIDANSHYSIITICKYDIYQKIQEESEQPTVQRTIQPIGQPNGQPIVQHVDTTIEGLESKEGIEQDGDFEFLTKKEQQVIIPEMMAIWKKYKPDYFSDKEIDYHALLEIAYNIANAKEWRRCSVLDVKKSECLTSWDTIAKFISPHSYFGKLTLDSVANKKMWQKIRQEMASINGTTGVVKQMVI